MLTRKQAEEILYALSILPSEKVAEVQDFILFLKERYGYEKSVDENDTWTNEDLRDLTDAVLSHAVGRFEEEQNRLSFQKGKKS
jgi:Protein of unknown function (DUF2281).